MLIHHTHLGGDSPVRTSHALYVRDRAQDYDARPGLLPEVLLRLPISLRGFDSAAMMVAANLAEGAAVAPAIEAMLDDPRVAVLHLHYARPGCHAARATRA